MPAVPIARLRAEIECLSTPPLGSPATWWIARQILDGLAKHSGVKRTSDLTPTAIADWIRADPKSPANTLKLLSSLRHICNHAVLKGWLKVSPFAFRKLESWVDDPADDEDDDQVERHHSLDDLGRVFRDLRARSSASWHDHRLYAVALTTFLTGARALEIQASRVEDYDLTGRWLRIRPNERRRLKTRKSRRRVPLTAELFNVLSAWLPESKSVWAFPGSRRVGPWISGGPGYRPLDCLKAAGERSGVTGLTFLSLRHSYITHSAGPWGVPDLLTQRIVGHTRRETTSGYRGFDPANVRSGIARISLGLDALSLSA